MPRALIEYQPDGLNDSRHADPASEPVCSSSNKNAEQSLPEKVFCLRAIGKNSRN